MKGSNPRSDVELVALRGVAPRSAAQRFLRTLDLRTPSIPPLHAAGLSLRDNRYQHQALNTYSGEAGAFPE